MSVLDAPAVHRRYLALIGLRWLPVGLLIPVFVLLPLSRGLSLTQVGLVFAVQGLVVFLLELPTGGLADSIGRRPVLLVAGVVSLASLALFYLAHSVEVFVAAMVLQGIYRALDSGPLEAWYVDTTLAAEPGRAMERGLSAGSSVLSLTIAGGALLSGALIAIDPFPEIETLGLPVLVSIALVVAYTIAIALLMHELPRARDARALAASVRAVPAVIREGLGLLRASRVLLALVSVELFWGFSMAAFESLFPVRLSEAIGDTDEAAALMGPVASAGWFASAAGAALIVVVSRRIGVARSAAALRVIQGLTVIGMGLIGGPVGLIAAYLGCYVAHGASNPMHMTLLHRQVDGPHRTTVLSMNSMVAQPAGAAGAIVLLAIADGWSVSTAMIVGGIVCALAAPLYLPARRAEVRAEAAVALTEETSTT
jgi:predicted MFS family arabinose efflux permease